MGRPESKGRKAKATKNPLGKANAVESTFDTASAFNHNLLHFQSYIATCASESEERDCFHCKDGGNLIACDVKGCPKWYHSDRTQCLVTCPPVPMYIYKGGVDFICPRHFCSVCNSAKTACSCRFCPFSLCNKCSFVLDLKVSIYVGRRCICIAQHKYLHSLHSTYCLSIINYQHGGDNSIVCKQCIVYVNSTAAPKPILTAMSEVGLKKLRNRAAVLRTARRMEAVRKEVRKGVRRASIIELTGEGDEEIGNNATAENVVATTMTASAPSSSSTSSSSSSSTRLTRNSLCGASAAADAVVPTPPSSTAAKAATHAAAASATSAAVVPVAVVVPPVATVTTTVSTTTLPVEVDYWEMCAGYTSLS